MLVAIRFFAGMTKNGDSKRLIVVQECNKNAALRLVKVIKYSNTPGEYSADLFAGEYQIARKEYMELVAQAKSLGVLSYGA